MKIHNKIKAFTISEVVVVLILSVIIIGLAFSVLSLTQKHLSAIQNNFSQNTELNMLEQSLWIDFNRFSKIKFDELKNEMRFTNEIDSVSYQFKSDYIIKERDTFLVQFQEKVLFFDGLKVKAGEIDALKLETSKKQYLFVFKKNDATSFIN